MITYGSTRGTNRVVMNVMNDEEENLVPLDHAPVLFLDEKGNSLTFVIKPCKEKEALREMIEVGYFCSCVIYSLTLMLRLCVLSHILKSVVSSERPLYGSVVSSLIKLGVAGV